MNTKKKSLTVEELVAKIKSCKKGLTTKQMMAELREQFSFSKDKWSAARRMLDNPVAPKKTTVVKEDTDSYDQFFDTIDDMKDIAWDTAADIFAFCKGHKNVIVTPDVCPSVAPSLYEALDKAVEAGLLTKVEGYTLGDAVRKSTKTTQKKAK